MQKSLAFYIVISAMHIIFISFQKEKLRRISKVLIIPALIVFYLFSARSVYIFTVMALVFGWIGDILLINKRRRINFKLGLVAFLLGHICYIITFVNRLKIAASFEAPKFNMIAAFICIPLALLAIIPLLKFIKPNKDMRLPVIVYILGIETMCFMALEVFVCNPGLGEAITLIGSIFFMTSDALLGHFTFGKYTRLGAVFIMVFYVLAQACIITGLVL